jgi:hypothetical protein
MSKNKENKRRKRERKRKRNNRGKEKLDAHIRQETIVSTKNTCGHI